MAPPAASTAAVAVVVVHASGWERAGLIGLGIAIGVVSTLLYQWAYARWRAHADAALPPLHQPAAQPQQQFAAFGIPATGAAPPPYSYWWP